MAARVGERPVQVSGALIIGRFGRSREQIVQLTAIGIEYVEHWAAKLY